MLLGIIFITKTLHKRTQSIQKTSIKEFQQFSKFEIFALSVKVGAPAGGRKHFAETLQYVRIYVIIRHCTYVSYYLMYVS